MGKKKSKVPAITIQESKEEKISIADVSSFVKIQGLRKRVGELRTQKNRLFISILGSVIFPSFFLLLYKLTPLKSIIDAYKDSYYLDFLKQVKSTYDQESLATLTEMTENFDQMFLSVLQNGLKGWIDFEGWECEPGHLTECEEILEGILQGISKQKVEIIKSSIAEIFYENTYPMVAGYYNFPKMRDWVKSDLSELRNEVKIGLELITGKAKNIQEISQHVMADGLAILKFNKTIFLSQIALGVLGNFFIYRLSELWFTPAISKELILTEENAQEQIERLSHLIVQLTPKVNRNIFIARGLSIGSIAFSLVYYLYEDIKNLGPEFFIFTISLIATACTNLFKDCRETYIRSHFKDYIHKGENLIKELLKNIPHDFETIMDSSLAQSYFSIVFKKTSRVKNIEVSEIISNYLQSQGIEIEQTSSSIFIPADFILSSPLTKKEIFKNVKNNIEISIQRALNINLLTNQIKKFIKVFSYDDFDQDDLLDSFNLPTTSIKFIIPLSIKNFLSQIIEVFNVDGNTISYEKIECGISVHISGFSIGKQENLDKLLHDLREFFREHKIDSKENKENKLESKYQEPPSLPAPKLKRRDQPSTELEARDSKETKISSKSVKWKGFFYNPSRTSCKIYPLEFPRRVHDYRSADQVTHYVTSTVDLDLLPEPIAKAVQEQIEHPRCIRGKRAKKKHEQGFKRMDTWHDKKLYPWRLTVFKEGDYRGYAREISNSENQKLIILEILVPDAHKMEMRFG